MCTLSFIADICGIIGFVFTGILWLKIDRFKQEVEKQRINYVKTQKSIITNLKALRDNICNDVALNRKTISKLREELFAMQNDFGRILNKDAKKYISSTISMLDCNVENINIDILLKNINYLVSRFRNREA